MFTRIRNSERRRGSLASVLSPERSAVLALVGEFELGKGSGVDDQEGAFGDSPLLNHDHEASVVSGDSGTRRYR